MKIEILASVMNQKNKDEIVKRLGVSDSQKCLIVNQVVGDGDRPKDDVKSSHRFISLNEKGLSKSRNHALDLAKGEIVLLSDDDCEYVEGYENVVRKAYRENPNADIIGFDFVCADKTRKTMKKGRVGYLRSMKMSSAQITFKKSSIRRVGGRFDEGFGTGSGKYEWGEENIFLFDCLRSGLRIYYVPAVTNCKGDFGTTWDKSNTSEHFEQQGAIYYRMSSRWWRVLALQFALRKRKIYGKDMSGWAVYKSMVKGAKAYRKEKENEQK